jgi:hypothetical protein
VPTDPSTEPAPTTTRRSFLTRTAVGSALVTAGAMASPVGRFLPLAGAQDEPAPDPDANLQDADFAAAAAIAELSAVLAYQAAFDARSKDESIYDDATQARLLKFQGQHNDVATTLAETLPTDAPEPAADPALVKAWSAPFASAGDAAAIYRGLATVETTLAATHLDAIGALIDPITAKIAAQVLTVESEKAALLSALAGDTLDVLATAEVTTDASALADAVKAAKAAAEAATTTTTAAGETTTTAAGATTTSAAGN